MIRAFCFVVDLLKGNNSARRVAHLSNSLTRDDSMVSLATPPWHPINLEACERYAVL